MARLSKPVSASDHSAGPEDAPVVLVEYGDYECPNCGEAYPILRELRQQAGDILRFVFRNFPLVEIHPHAEQAAEAAESAAAQGKFWEMHNVLFENQEALAPRYLRLYARQIGLDLDRFDNDMETHAYGERIHTDFVSGMRSGVNGTPTFFINGTRFDQSWDYDSLWQAVIHTAAEKSRR